jgi:hypothetical protein
VAATATLLDVLVVDGVPEALVEFGVEVPRGVTVFAVGNEVDVGAGRRVLDRLDRAVDHQRLVVAVDRLFEVRRPRVVVDAVGHRFGVVVCCGHARGLPLPEPVPCPERVRR